MAATPTRTAGMLFALALLALSPGLFLSAQSPQQVGTWASSGAIADGRTGAASVALQDGTTLIAGGVAGDAPTSSVLRHDPATHGLVAAGQLLAARVGHTATLLEDGRVLIVGGRVGDAPSSDIELFDPDSGGSTLLGQLSQPRTGHAAARVADGIVVVLGGATVDGVVLDSVERVNVSTGNVTAGSNRMLHARASASATTLIDGRVLVAGGNNGTADLRSAELYFPWTQAFEPTSNELSVARSAHSAVLLPHNAGVLIAGGSSNGVSQASVDLFLPAESPDPFSFGINTFVATGAMAGARAGAAAGPGREGFAWVDGGGSVDSETYRFATIKTDKDDYAPGQTAVITGSGWTPGEDVRLLFQEDPAVHDDYELTVTADAAGNIYWDEWAPEQHDVGVRFYLLASDSRSRAQTTFTDGNLSSTIVFSITPTSVTPSGALNWTVEASCVDGGGPNTCSSEGFTIGGDVQDGYSIEIQQATNATFTAGLVVRATATTLNGAASGTFAAPASGGPYFYRARHVNQNLANSPVQGNDPNSWQPQNSNPVTVTLLSDGTAPTTTKTVGTPKFGTNDLYVTGATQFTLSCTDNAGGTGCAATFYQIVAAAASCPSNTNEALWVSYSTPFTLPAPDGEVRVCYFSKDTAGNRETPKFQNHFRDTAAPETTATATANAASYASGAWTRFNVSVDLSATDGSGNAGVEEITYAATGATTIASTTVAGASVTGLVFSAEGTTTLTFSAKDNVGNVEAEKTFTIKIDKTAPSIADLGPTTSANGAGWYNTDVTNRFKATDALSGLDTACLGVFPDIAGERIQSKTTSGEGTAVTVTSDSCADAAGNTASAVTSAEFKIDKTAPVIVQHDFSPAANAAGWHNTNVTVRFKATDALSGLGVACSAAFPNVSGDRLQSKTTSGEGLAVTVISDGCTDGAGNTASAVTSTPFKIDKTAPTVSIASPAAGNTIVLTIAANGTASDGLSGIKSVTLNGSPAAYNAGSGTWATTGNVTLVCGPNVLTAVATDNADLSSSASVTVTRLCFTFEYLRPLEQSYGSTTTIVNDGKYGRVIPVKGIVRRDGVVQTELDLASLGLTLRIGVNGVACGGGVATDAVEEYADAGLSNSGTNVFRWTLDGFWIYNLDTKAPPSMTMVINNCYRLDAYVQDTAANKVKVSDSPYVIFKPVK